MQLYPHSCCYPRYISRVIQSMKNAVIDPDGTWHTESESMPGEELAQFFERTSVVIPLINNKTGQPG